MTIIRSPKSFVSKCLAGLLTVLPLAASAAAANEAAESQILVNPAQQVVFSQAMPLPADPEPVQLPDGEPIMAPQGNASFLGTEGCCCTSSIADFYNSDCGCGRCPRCRACGSGCSSHGQQFKRNCQARHWGYPEYFCERPFGSCNRGVVCKMIANGLRDQMVLYDYDFGFGDEADQLKERGLLQLQKLAGRFHIAQTPLLIQASDDPQLDNKRQAHVMAALSAMGLEMSADMVVVARPRIRGLDGIEGPPIYSNLLEQTRLRGNVGIETEILRDVGFGGSSVIGTAAGTTPAYTR